MSTKTFDSALDFMPNSKAALGKNGGKSYIKAIIEALSEGRSAEAEYRRQIGRGLEPSKAVAKAFE